MKTAVKILSAVAIIAAGFAATTQNAEAGWSRWGHARGYVVCPPPVYYCPPQTAYVVPEPVYVAPPVVVVPEVIRPHWYHAPFWRHHWR